MSEQETVNQSASKNERSASNQSCRLSYDSFIAASKNFLHHMSFLSDEEKTEYKSLANHVKQLYKCNEVIKKLSTPVKRALAPKVVVEQAVPVTESNTSKPKRGGSAKKTSIKEEQSPTAQVVAAVVTEQKKSGRSKKVAEPVVQEPVVQELVLEPVVEVKKSAPKKAGASKTK